MCKVPAAAGTDPEPERRPKLLKARERAAGAEAAASFGNLHLTLSQTGSPGRVQSREQTCTGEDAGGCREAKGSGEKPLRERGGHTRAHAGEWKWGQVHRVGRHWEENQQAAQGGPRDAAHALVDGGGALCGGPRGRKLAKMMSRLSGKTQCPAQTWGSHLTKPFI